MKTKAFVFVFLFFPMIISAQDAPEADFECTPNPYGDTCCFSFTDLSKNSPNTWWWMFEGGLPQASTVQNPQAICYTVNGIYDVSLYVSNDYGSDSIINVDLIYVSDDTCACLDGTDIEQLEQPKTIIYPNPVTEKAVIIFHKPVENASLMLYSNQGKLIRKEENITGKAYTFHRQGIKNGLYFIVILDKSTIYLKQTLMLSGH